MSQPTTICSSIFTERRDVLGVPTMACKLLRQVVESVLVEFTVLFGGNDGDFVVKLAILIYGDAALAIGQGVTVELGGLRFARKCS